MKSPKICEFSGLALIYKEGESTWPPEGNFTARCTCGAVVQMVGASFPHHYVPVVVDWAVDGKEE